MASMLLFLYLFFAHSEPPAAPPPVEFRTELNVGNLLFAIGQHERASIAYQRAIALAEARPDSKLPRLELAAACNNLGVLCRTTRQFADAERQFRRAAQLFDVLSTFDHRRLLAHVHSNLGLLFDGQGMFSHAREQYDKAVDLRESLARLISQTYTTVGQIGAAHDPGGAYTALALDTARQELVRQFVGADRDILAARLLAGAHIPREEAYCIFSSLIVFTGPETATAERIGPKLWRNRFFGKTLDAEIAKAAELGIAPVRILCPTSVAEIGKDGAIFKWVVTEQGELFGLKRLEGDLIKHSLVSRGRPVLAAGNARVQGNKALLDRRSGHYRPDRDSMIVAKQKFEAAGFVVEVIEGGIE